MTEKFAKSSPMGRRKCKPSSLEINKGKAQREISKHVQTQETARGLLASLLGLIVPTLQPS